MILTLHPVIYEMDCRLQLFIVADKVLARKLEQHTFPFLRLTELLDSIDLNRFHFALDKILAEIVEFAQTTNLLLCAAITHYVSC